MPRFKTVVHMRCENGHTNLFEIRTQADSSDLARAYTEGEAAFRRCKYCKTIELLVLVQMFPTKEIPLAVGSMIWGYTCDCGERVEVARVESGDTVIPIPPASKTVKCSKGHSRVIQKREFPSLEHWWEEA